MKTFDESNFKSDVLNSSKPVLVDFWAEWCHPCKMLAPVLEEVDKELAGKIIIGKVDLEANESLGNTYQIMNIPTLLIFRNGQIVEQMAGFMDKRTLLSRIQPHLS